MVNLKKGNVFMYALIVITVLIVGSLFWEKISPTTPTEVDDGTCDVDCQIDKLHDQKAENMKLLMDSKQRAWQAKNTFIKEYNEYKLRQNVNKDLYDKIISLVNEGSTTETLDSVRDELLGLSDEQEISINSPKLLEALTLTGN